MREPKPKGSFADGLQRPKAGKLVGIKEALDSNPTVKAILASKPADAPHTDKVEPAKKHLPRLINGKRANPPTPKDWFEVSISPTGIAVNELINRHGQVVAIGMQFPDSNHPTREEKDILELVKEPPPEIRDKAPHGWKGKDKQWERDAGNDPGRAVIDEGKLVAFFDAERVKGPSR